MSADEIRLSVSEDAALKLLLRAGLNREQELSLIDHQPSEQSSHSPVTAIPEDQRSDYGAGLRAQPSTFETSVMLMMERMSQRLDNLSARMDRSSGALTPTPTSDHGTTPVQTDGRRSWADIPVDELADYTGTTIWRITLAL